MKAPHAVHSRPSPAAKLPENSKWGTRRLVPSVSMERFAPPGKYGRGRLIRHVPAVDIAAIEKCWASCRSIWPSSSNYNAAGHRRSAAFPLQNEGKAAKSQPIERSTRPATRRTATPETSVYFRPLCVRHHELALRLPGGAYEALANPHDLVRLHSRRRAAFPRPGCRLRDASIARRGGVFRNDRSDPLRPPVHAGLLRRVPPDLETSSQDGRPVVQKQADRAQ
jgi:hypothetical protein